MSDKKLIEALSEFQNLEEDYLQQDIISDSYINSLTIDYFKKQEIPKFDQIKLRTMISLENFVKVGLAILFFICLLDMPYGYYQLVRFLALLGFAILAYKSYERQEGIMVIVYVGLAILFQPLMKIYLGREFWNIVNVVVGIGLIVSVFLNSNPDKQKTGKPYS